MWGIELAVMVAMIGVNSVFAAYEIALASIPATRLKRLVQEKRAGAAVALRMKEGIEGSLAVVQMGITLVGAIAAATGGAGAEESIAPWLQARLGLRPAWAEVLAIAAVVLPLTMVTIMVGELVPKVFALRHKEWVCLTFSPPMRAFSIAVRPAVWLFETGASTIVALSERLWRPAGHLASEGEILQELHASAALARTSSLIGEREERIIQGAARLSQRHVKDVMLPAGDVSMLSLGDSIGDCLAAAHLEMHTRFPVTERKGDPQGIVGYVNFKDIVAVLRLSPGEPSLRGILRGIPEFREDLPISAALEVMMRERTHIAIVRDAAGKVTGLMTMEDIIEDLVGDIQDEYDLLPTHCVKAGAGWVVGGGVTPAKLREATGIDLTGDLPKDGARNFDAWVAGHLGRTVKPGDTLERGNVRVAVRKVRRQLLLEAHVTGK